jgi:hypothetical protein
MRAGGDGRAVVAVVVVAVVGVTRRRATRQPGLSGLCLFGLLRFRPWHAQVRRSEASERDVVDEHPKRGPHPAAERSGARFDKPTSRPRAFQVLGGFEAEATPIADALRVLLNEVVGPIGHCRLGAGCYFRRPGGPRAASGMLAAMGRQTAVVLYLLAMAAVIVGIDLAFFRDRFWARLAVNVGIVLVFAAFYLRFFRHP